MDGYICAKCKAENDKAARVCKYCGAPIKETLFYDLQLEIERNRNKKYISPGLILGVISAVGMCIALYLPFIKLSYLGLNKTKIMAGTAFGHDMLFLIVVSLLFVLVKKDIHAMVSGSCIVLMMIWKTVHIHKLIKKVSISNFYKYVSIGAGFYLLFVFGILMIVSASILLYERKH